MRQFVFLVGLFSLLALSPGRSYSLAHDPLDRNTVVSIAQSQVGTTEVGCNNCGLQVAQYLRSVSIYKPAPWCGAFVNWTLEQAGKQMPKGMAWVPKWFTNDRVIYNSKGVNRATPQPGDIGGLYFSNLGRYAHLFIIKRWPPESGGMVLTIEGNTNDGGSRDGNGVWQRRRFKRLVSVVSNWIDEPKLI